MPAIILILTPALLPCRRRLGHEGTDSQTGTDRARPPGAASSVDCGERAGAERSDGASTECAARADGDRQSDDEGKSVSVCVDLGDRRFTQNIQNNLQIQNNSQVN